jgi:soluble lytic murein transglycosylase-like protein
MSRPQWHLKLPADLIADAAARNHIDPDLVAAIVMKESEGDCWRPRHEKHYRDFYFPREIAEYARVSFETMIVMQQTSWGMMQVLGAVAYERGLPQDQCPTMLCLPHLGLEYGCRQLAYLFGRFTDEERVVAAYNAGSPRKTAGNMYVNQAYVDKVYGYLRELRKLK